VERRLFLMADKKQRNGIQEGARARQTHQGLPTHNDLFIQLGPTYLLKFLPLLK
jgi:hypothetical protein